MLELASSILSLEAEGRQKGQQHSQSAQGQERPSSCQQPSWSQAHPNTPLPGLAWPLVAAQGHWVLSLLPVPKSAQQSHSPNTWSLSHDGYLLEKKEKGTSPHCLSFRQTQVVPAFPPSPLSSSSMENRKINLLEN